MSLSDRIRKVRVFSKDGNPDWGLNEDDVKQAIKELKEKYLEIHRLERDSSKWIDEIFGEELC